MVRTRRHGTLTRGLGVGESCRVRGTVDRPALAPDQLLMLVAARLVCDGDVIQATHGSDGGEWTPSIRMLSATYETSRGSACGTIMYSAQFEWTDVDGSVQELEWSSREQTARFRELTARFGGS